MKKNLFLLLVLALLLSLCAPVLAAPDTAASSQEPADPAETAASEGDAADGDASAPYVVPGEPHTVLAKSAMLIELNTDQTLLEQDADLRVYPASLTKIMTCMLTLRNGTLSDTVTVSESALEGLSIYGSTAGLQAGEQLTLEELLYCMMLSSANEACNIAAEYVAGSVDAFVDMMNEEAAALGCTGTHFANPHGLHDEDHYTTARDLSLIVRAALQSETFRTITSTVSHTVPATNLSDARELATTNLLITPGTKYYYEYAQGIKTGFTSEAGLCLISTANNGKLQLLSIVCGADYVFLEDGEQVNQNFTETKALFEYGFDNFAYAKVLTTLYPITQIPVLHSAGPESSLLAPDRELTALLPAGFDETDIKQEIALLDENGVEAPIAKGQVLGKVTVSYQDHTLGSVDLVAITDIPRSEIAAAAAETTSFLSQHWWKLLLAAIVVFLLIVILVSARRRARRRKLRDERRRRLRAQRDGLIDFPGGRWDDEE